MALIRCGGSAPVTLDDAVIANVTANTGSRTYATTAGHYYILIGSTSGIATCFPSASQYTVVSAQVAAPNTRGAIVKANGSAISWNQETSIHECYELKLD